MLTNIDSSSSSRNRRLHAHNQQKNIPEVTQIRMGVNNDNLSINTDSSGNDNYVMTGGGTNLQEVKEVNLIIHRPKRSRSYMK